MAIDVEFARDAAQRAAYRWLLHRLFDGLPPARCFSDANERRPHVCDAEGGDLRPANEMVPASAIVSHTPGAGEQEAAP